MGNELVKALFITRGRLFGTSVCFYYLQVAFEPVLVSPQAKGLKHGRTEVCCELSVFEIPRIYVIIANSVDVVKRRIDVLFLEKVEIKSNQSICFL